MKTVVPVLAAGSTFTGAVLLGLVLGIWIGSRSGQPLWTLGGLLAGLVVGGYAALRLLLRSV